MRRRAREERRGVRARPHGRLLYKRPHSSMQQRRYLAYTGFSWNILTGKENVGSTSSCGVIVRDACATPDLVTAAWEVFAGGTWVEDAGIRCVIMRGGEGPTA